MTRAHQQKEWLQFEKDVAALFHLFGYTVTHDAKVQAAQTDVVATSPKRTKPNIVVECKYHADDSAKVGINEVQLFVSRVSALRMAGEIDQGYLVTNTGFTSDARAALVSTPASHYVFLVSYNELIQSILDVEDYLKEYVSSYEKSADGLRFIDLYLLETTDVPRTVFDGIPGEVFNSRSQNGDKEVIKFLIVPEAFLDSLGNVADILEQPEPHASFALNPIRFLEVIRALRNAQEEATEQYRVQLLACMDEAVGEVSRSMENGTLHEVYRNIPLDKEGIVCQSPPGLVSALLDAYATQIGSQGKESILLGKRGWRRRIQRRICEGYESRRDRVQPPTVLVPQFLRDFGAIIIDALGLEPWRLPAHTGIDATAEGRPRGKVFLERPPLLAHKAAEGEAEERFTGKRVWTWIDEIDNTLLHLRAGDITPPSLRVLPREPAIRRLLRFASEDPANVLVLLGDYGAGKTTLLRRAMSILAEQKLTRQDDPSCRIPLFIPLREYNKVPDMTALIKMFLQDHVEMPDVSLRAFRKLNEDGRLILLLDAFDEMLSRVTKADRRRCFREIAQFVSGRSKVVLTGRPGYFPDYCEFAEVMQPAISGGSAADGGKCRRHRICCVQLLDESQLEELIEKVPGAETTGLISVVRSQPDLLDLARRPVLASMIGETAKEVAQLGAAVVTARKLYEIYTNRWIEIEEDKGEFRLLINAEQKSVFVRYLAMQMHLTGLLSIHYSALDKSIALHFSLETPELVDHFSHDIRTCSFLNRSDDGYYSFIHKSFMEYFVACEFERLEDSIFASQFNKPLTPEMIALLDFDRLPPGYGDVWSHRREIGKATEAVCAMKEAFIQSQRYEEAAALRDLERGLIGVVEKCPRLFRSMRKSDLGDLLSEVARWLTSHESSGGFQELEIAEIRTALGPFVTCRLSRS